MAIIDDEGRLFGVVNVIDALVVLFVVAVLVAGVALVTGGGGGTDATRFATIDLGTQPEFVATQVASGDRLADDADGNLSLTDVYYTPGDDGQVRLIARAELRGTNVTELRSFQYAGRSIRQGGELDITTPEYQLSGTTITRLDRNGTALRTSEARVRLTTTVPADVAPDITAGDVVTVADREVATVEAVELAPTGDPTRRHVTIGATLRTYSGDDRRRYAGRPVTVGASLPLTTDEYSLTGQVIRVGTADIDTAETDLVVETSLSEAAATELAVGDSYTVGNATAATIESTQLYPGDGNSVRAVLGLSVGTRIESGLRYLGTTPLTVGAAVPFRTSAYGFTGTVSQLDAASLNTTTTDVVLESTVSTATANTLAPGDTYRVQGDAVVTVESVQVSPTGNPARKRVLVGATLQTVTRDGTPEFGGNPVRLGTTVPFRTSAYGFSGSVTRLGTTTVNTTTTDVVLESTVSTATANAITAGDSFRVRGEPVVTVDSARTYPTGNPARKRVLVGATLQTVTRDGTPEFGGDPVRLGTTVPVRTGTYDTGGRVIRVGSQTPPGEVTETTVELQLDNVAPEVANSVRTGLTETTDGTTFATIVDRRSTNATVVLTSESGDIFRREHPVNQDVSLTVRLRTRTTGSGLTFHGRSLQENTRIVLDLGTTTVSGTVTEIRS